MFTGGHGVRMQHDYVHDVAGSATGASWLRLTRSGSTITGYESADGVSPDNPDGAAEHERRSQSEQVKKMGGIAGTAMEAAKIVFFVAIALFLFLYARAMAQKDVLR